MKTTEKIDLYERMIESIDYNNREGGRYAYVQFLSYTREVMILLQPIKKIQTQMQAIESIHWVFNKYVGLTFNDHQRMIFDAKRREIKTIFETLKIELDDINEKEPDPSVFLKELELH